MHLQPPNLCLLQCLMCLNPRTSNWYLQCVLTSLLTCKLPILEYKSIFAEYYYFFELNFLDKSLIVWRLTRDESSYGVPQKSLHGHGHFVSDVILSSDGQFALSGSWDHTLRLWDLSTSVKFSVKFFLN